MTEMSIRDHLERAMALPVTASAEAAGEALAELRTLLSRGLPGSRDTGDLRAYLSLADRFGFHADVWNAANLLEVGEPLDPLARVARARAWLRLFPDVAVRHPELLDRLMDAGEGGRPSDNALASVLIAWIDHAAASTAATGAAQTVAAVHEVADRWWPRHAWLQCAPGLAVRFAEAATAIAEQAVDLPETLRARLALPFATALRLAEVSEPDEGDTANHEPGDHFAPTTVGDTSPPSEEQLRALAASLADTKRRIWVVGRLSTDWHRLMGVAKKLGVERSVFTHVDYDEIARRSMIHRINLGSDVGILVGPVPHSAAGVGDHSSPVAQFRAETGLPVFEMRARSRSRELRITKTSFETALMALLTILTTDGNLGSIAA